MIRVVVADDEPIARLGIKTLLAPHRDVVVVGECRTGIEARRALSTLAPDLLFLDIKMPDLDGFGALAGTDDATRPAIVFTTAFEDHARRAFDVQAVDYLLKPFDRRRFELALARGRARVEAMRGRDDRRLTVRGRSGLTVIDLDRVTHVEARGNYVRLHSGDGRLLHREALVTLAARLERLGFHRAGRSLLVNLAAVRHAAALPNGRWRLTLVTGAEVTTSRRLGKGLSTALAHPGPLGP